MFRRAHLVDARVVGHEHAGGLGGGPVDGVGPDPDLLDVPDGRRQGEHVGIDRPPRVDEDLGVDGEAGELAGVEAPHRDDLHVRGKPLGEPLAERRERRVDQQDLGHRRRAGPSSDPEDRAGTSSRDPV